MNHVPAVGIHREPTGVMILLDMPKNLADSLVFKRNAKPISGDRHLSSKHGPNVT
jgi:hypothetical protein